MSLSDEVMAVSYVAGGSSNPTGNPQAPAGGPGTIATADSNFTVVSEELKLAAIPDGDVLANISGASAEPGATGLSAAIDHVFGSARGSMLVRGASGWEIDPNLTNDQGAVNGLVYNLSGASFSLADINRDISSTSFSIVPPPHYQGALAAVNFLRGTGPAFFGVNAANTVANGTLASPQIANAGTIIWGFGGGAWNGSNFILGTGAIRGVASETWSGTTNGTYVGIWATPPNLPGIATQLQVASFQSGMQILNAGTPPTGGDMGGGTINVEGGYYTQGVLNGTAGYTVATLPAAPGTGARAYVTDATTPTFLGALTGGGTVTCPVFYNGSAWVAG
ncbi:MAG: hypothetical protein KGL39_03340 [Patescibacteria group bacterium]|nr:hypothetical protein [Patescibacteria group bacterium]